MGHNRSGVERKARLKRYKNEMTRLAAKEPKAAAPKPVKKPAPAPKPVEKAATAPKAAKKPTKAAKPEK